MQTPDPDFSILLEGRLAAFAPSALPWLAAMMIVPRPVPALIPAGPATWRTAPARPVMSAAA